MIAGPQKAAQEVKKLIQEVRTGRPDITAARNLVKKLIEKHYGTLFRDHKKSQEIERYNFNLYQLQILSQEKAALSGKLVSGSFGI